MDLDRYFTSIVGQGGLPVLTLPGLTLTGLTLPVLTLPTLTSTGAVVPEVPAVPALYSFQDIASFHPHFHSKVWKGKTPFMLSIKLKKKFTPNLNDQNRFQFVKKIKI